MKLAVIGGGPAGMMAAISAARNGADVTLYEKNEKLGKKLYISGKGRCNVTNDCSTREFLQNVATNPKFIIGAVNKFTPQDTMNFLEESGLNVKVERGNRVFPCSDKSSDVIKAFSHNLASLGVNIRLNCEILKIEYCKNRFLLTTITDIIDYDSVIIATGGASYPLTGSTGDGYLFCESLGHTVTPRKAALCRIKCNVAQELEGLSLKNVTVSLKDSNGKKLDEEFGELLFTADGVSGPSVLTLSSRINKLNVKNAEISIDLKPALDYEKLDLRVLRDFSERMNKNFINSLNALMPEKMCKIVAEQSGIPLNKKVNQISAAERRKLVETVKSVCFDYVGIDIVEHAIVTCGGVEVSEVNPSTMESKICAGLYIVGELLDVDAYTGGFNIQIALSTGYVAGVNAALRR